MKRGVLSIIEVGLQNDKSKQSKLCRYNIKVAHFQKDSQISSNQPMEQNFRPEKVDEWGLKMSFYINSKTVNNRLYKYKPT